MNDWKLRLLIIGLVNAIIAIAYGVARGFSLPVIGLASVGILLFVIGIAWNPKEEDDST
ncbi:MAG: hypothetical protein ACFFBL_11345 [Promethearchaeota archaeon]